MRNGDCRSGLSLPTPWLYQSKHAFEGKTVATNFSYSGRLYQVMNRFCIYILMPMLYSSDFEDWTRQARQYNDNDLAMIGSEDDL
jgi:hypothetical protein